MNKIMNKIQMVNVLIASVCVIAPGADARSCRSVKFSGNAAYVRGMSDVKPSVLALDLPITRSVHGDSGRAAGGALCRC